MDCLEQGCCAVRPSRDSGISVFGAFSSGDDRSSHAEYGLAYRSARSHDGREPHSFGHMQRDVGLGGPGTGQWVWAPLPRELAQKVEDGTLGFKFIGPDGAQ